MTGVLNVLKLFYKPSTEDLENLIEYKLIPGKMKGYNSMNETIDLPPKEIQPPIFQVEFNGIQMYAVTVYFKHPHLLCNPLPLPDSQTGKGLYIQNGTSPEKDFIQIPLESKDLTSIWKPSSCVPGMGLHYFRNLSRSLPCEKIFPVFLMYDSEGKLSAFGWAFQGKPMNLAPIKWFHLVPKIYPFIFDTKKLPSCMFHPKFSVFGLHIWLRDPQSELLKCKIIQPQKKTTPAVPWHKKMNE
ncbi:hypothetical protein KUTeg_022911 [Tegillarca granosa]|uniref:Uncharacterized protein n=1 Tax=Tegillarca granosa TaxID=220873 RepID=A0ABQ9E052_TEGGR|nr:hypothetical protein KUTeg_022911 [Tegillarca granosa]